MNIDTVIAEAVKETAEVQKAAPEAAEVTETPQVETPEEAKEEAQPKEAELTPEQLEKRFRNRESKLNSKLADFKRRNRELEALVGQTKQPEAQPNTQASSQSAEPKLDDYETWEDYSRALIKFEAKQIRETENKQTQETQKNQELTKWVDERSQRVDTRIPELTQTISDFESVIEEIEDTIPALTPEFARIALEADDINLAAYTLHKEGKLLEVLKMPPMRAAMEIAKAEIRGAAYLKQPKPVTNAPAPITSARGNSVGSTSIEKLDGVSLLKAIRST